MKCTHAGGGWTSVQSQQECDALNAEMNRPTVECRIADGGQSFAQRTAEECERAKQKFTAISKAEADQRAREAAAVLPGARAMLANIERRLEEIKRENWRVYNDQEAALRTNAAWQQAVDATSNWSTACWEVREMRSGPSYDDCSRSGMWVWEQLLKWDWRSPPRP